MTEIIKAPDIEDTTPVYIQLFDGTFLCTSRRKATPIYHAWKKYKATPKGVQVDKIIGDKESGERLLSDIRAVMGQTEYDEHAKQKAGMTKCTYGNWHNKGEKCYCAEKLHAHDWEILVREAEARRMALPEPDPTKPMDTSDIIPETIEYVKNKYPDFTEYQVVQMARKMMTLYKLVPAMRNLKVYGGIKEFAESTGLSKTDTAEAVTKAEYDRNLKMSIERVKRKVGGKAMIGFNFTGISALIDGKSIGEFRLNKQGNLVDYKDNQNP
jgi:hypothetical protein